MTTPLVISEQLKPGVIQLTLNRPEKRNALSVALLEAFLAALDAAEADAGQRVLILTGAGSVFCAGMDLAEAGNPAVAGRSGELIATMLRRVVESRLITIAVVQGAALAGGAGLMSACDFAYAEGSARLGYPEPRRGLIAALVMTFLRRQLRERDARRLLLTGESVSGTEAAEMGLVSAAIGTELVMPTALRTANEVMLGGPEAVVQTKKLLASLWPSPLTEDFTRAMHVHHDMRDSAEMREGVAAFREKRKPKWVVEN